MKLSRLGTVVSVVALGGGLLVGCSPEPEPTPTPTAAFASEEEAFAAAEEVYREYIDALNNVDASNPETFQPLFELSTGGVNESDREGFSTMHAEGYTLSGETVLVSFEGTAAEAPYDQITAALCLDVSEVEVIDPNGVSKVNPSRPPIYGVDVMFVSAGGSLRISSSDADEEAACSD